MYKNVLVYDDDKGRWADYTVTSNANKFNGYVEDSKGRRYEFTKSTPSEDFEWDSTLRIYRKPKPTVYRRSLPFWTRDEYDYLYTNVTDVYYNERRNRFLGRTYTYSY